jgi:hypothetical protein
MTSPAAIGNVKMPPLSGVRRLSGPRRGSVQLELRSWRARSRGEVAGVGATGAAQAGASG